MPSTKTTTATQPSVSFLRSENINTLLFHIPNKRNLMCECCLVVVRRGGEGWGIMHSQRVLPSDSSVGLKHGREERDENLYRTHSLSEEGNAN